MKKVLLAGATGNLGRHILQALKQGGFAVTALVRSQQKGATLTPPPDHFIYEDATYAESLAGCCRGIDFVVSALGKSISLNDHSRSSFHEIDFQANYNLLQEAKTAGVQQFIYISAFTAEQHPALAYFKAHANFSEALKHSGINYIIIQPTALFSAFNEMAAMARKGKLGVIGGGDKSTNPVFEGDVAKVILESIGSRNQVIPLGGKKVYTRLEIANLVAKAVNYRGKTMHAPKAIVLILLPLLKLFNRNLYHKLAFLTEVSTRDCVAPQIGAHSLEAYFKLPEEQT
ncbi:SDR family oxidoreductase [Pontibacter anaerobius]|uniref:SDR family oxidoreductase n=1 Tax=Pontibacter anaerobius TaxID=2993940 RepID=A0ABT3RBA2_9BACT|nr:SDR family oxidoreductase [Pontibacter anaerobius]MCX2739148.1 SDR family oxidoreductase [Pontibacter anaerobius]